MHQQSNALTPSFSKRIYTFPAFKADVRLIFDHMDDLRMITFGSLLGNTFDALLSRIAGKPAAGSSLWNELSVLFGVLWMPFSRLLLRSFNRR
jgi:hypothetical protein